jgi:hypothetical protein
MATIKTRSEPTVPAVIFVCLNSALRERESAKFCGSHFESLPDDENLGQALASMFEKDWGLDGAQLAELKQWPQPQLGILRSAVIQAARTVVATGLPLQCRCIGRAGNPRSISCTLDAEGYFEIVLVGPKLV